MLNAMLLFVLTILLIQYGSCRNAKRSYIIEKDYFGSFSGHGYTVYDSQRKKVLYRMEPQFGMTHQMHIFEGSESKDPIAKIKEKFFAWSYEATISIRNKNINRWTDGTVEYSFHMLTLKFTIRYNGQDVSMKDGMMSWDKTFTDPSNQQVLAQFRKKMLWGFGRAKHHLHVFSDKFPDLLYFFGFLVREHYENKDSHE